MPSRRFLSAAAGAAMAVSALPLAADPIGAGADSLPIFDAHMHYKQDAWAPFPPGTVIELMDRSGVAMALVSSTPDDGTVTLYEFAPGRIVPEARPYHGVYGQSNWTTAPGMLQYIRARLDAHPHVGIGEFHVHGVGRGDDDFLRAVAMLAKERGILLHIHTGAAPVQFFFDQVPDLKIVWAHAGMSSPPEEIMAMMDRHPALYADLSYREGDILTADGTLDPAWRAVLEKHQDRFMVGTDTWVNDQWARYGDLIAANRAWIRHFPREQAEKFAYRNAERLFGRPVSKDLLGTR